MKNRLFKRKTISSLSVLLLLSILFLFQGTQLLAVDQQEVNIYIDGNPVTFTESYGYPTIIDGRTMVPLRVISEDMGYEVDWSKDTWNQGDKRVWVKDKDVTIELEIGKNTALVNGKRVPIDTREENGKTIAVDTKAQLINARTYVPLRFISENMNCEVEWEIIDKTLFVYITRPVDVEETNDMGFPKDWPTIERIDGTASYDEADFVDNVQKIKDILEGDADPNMSDDGMLSYNPIGGSTENNFFYMINRTEKASFHNEDFTVLIGIKMWYTPDIEDLGTPYVSEYKKSNQMIKEIFRFYLPNSYEELYTIIDDGSNWRWTDADYSRYVNKDISNIIGSERKVMIKEAMGSTEIHIY